MSVYNNLGYSILLRPAILLLEGRELKLIKFSVTTHDSRRTKDNGDLFVVAMQ